MTRSFNSDPSSKNTNDEPSLKSTTSQPLTSSSSQSSIPSSSPLTPSSSTLLPLTVSSTIAPSTTEVTQDSTEQSQEEQSEEDLPLEERIKQISEEVEKLSSKETNDRDIGRQSFFSLSDLIKTLQPGDKKTNPQIDSDYSNTMRVLGESLLNEEGRNFKSSDSSHLEEMDPTKL